MNARIKQVLSDTHPFRLLARGAIAALGIGSYPWRVSISAVPRPPYGYMVYNAASLAARLGYPRISVIEFGVAGGNGLIALEHHAQQAGRHFGIEIEVYGFDTGAGLPPPLDYRDLPYVWQEGFYAMDVAKLKSRLRSAKLVLGNVESTARTFFEQFNPAPIGAVSHDLDYHSSTVAALTLFEADERRFLPRVYNYFDDILGGELELYNEYTGERLAIAEFNDRHADRKFAYAHYLLAKPVLQRWYHAIRICHLFKHPDYNKFISPVANGDQLSIA